MKSEVLSQYPLLGWTLFGFGLFVVVFIGIVIQAFSKSQRSVNEVMQNLPLQKGELS